MCASCPSGHPPVKRTNAPIKSNNTLSDLTNPFDPIIQHSAYWTCHNCGNFNNTNWDHGLCPVCQHVKCEYCYEGPAQGLGIEATPIPVNPPPLSSAGPTAHPSDPIIQHNTYWTCHRCHVLNNEVWNGLFCRECGHSFCGCCLYAPPM